jgi:hypothetical protein
MWAVSGKCLNCTTLDGIAFDGSTAFSATARRIDAKAFRCVYRLRHLGDNL